MENGEYFDVNFFITSIKGYINDTNDPLINQSPSGNCVKINVKKIQDFSNV